MPAADAENTLKSLEGVGIAAASAITGVIALTGELRSTDVIDNAAAERIRDALLSGLVKGPVEMRRALSDAIQQDWDRLVP